MKPCLVIALLFLFWLVCTRAQTTSCTYVGFKDQTAELGLDLANSAACLVDVDNDGWDDMICGGTYWRNNEGRGFVRMQGGLGSVVAADYDNDGFTDIFSYSDMKLFRNEGGKKFVEVALPPLPKTVSRGACWGDFNSDGFVDLYVGGYEDWDAGITYPSMILINHGGKSFEMTWSEAVYRTRGITACDFDRDGDLDIYVSNYRLQPNLLWLNDGTGKFNDVSAEYNALATSAGFDGGHSIGAAWGDFNNDGLMDIFAGNFAHVDNRGDQPKSRFLKNLGPKEKYHFEDMGTCGVFYQESYATPAAGDYDNDGNLDLMFTTVYDMTSFGKPNHSVLFHNEGNFVFSDATVSANLAGLPPTYQAAWADFNHDGNLDLVCGGKLFVNQGGTGNHWVEIRLRGDGREVNRSAIGAQVRIRLKDKTLTRQVEAGTGEGNQNDLTLHFGLGELAGPITLEILWPNGKTQTVRNIAVDRILEVRNVGAPEEVVYTVCAPFPVEAKKSEMKIIRRAFGVAAMLGVVVSLLVWFENAVSKSDMTEFDPQEMGRLESAMWRSYYEGHWVRLGWQTMKGACGQYGFSWWDGSRSSLHAARAALFFRKNTDDPRCLPELEQYYAIIWNATGRGFDIRAAAALELEWWKERRLGLVPQDYARTIAKLTGLIYGIPEGTVLDAARMRAEAMAYRDARRNGKMTEADWQEIARQLQLAYASLKESVVRGR